MKRRLIVLGLLFLSFQSQAQFAWWNNQHSWDGTTPWTEYMNYAHAYLGPNALPIPSFIDEDQSYFQSNTQHSFRRDDQFHSWHNELFWRRGHTRFQIKHQSLEYFKTSNDVRDLRVSRGETGKGVQAGDFLFNVSTRLFANSKMEIHITAHTKTAAGPLSDARFTDAPGYGYFFSGIHHLQSNWGNSVQKHSFQWDAGFQVYQTMWIAYPQNDGFLGNIKWSAEVEEWQYSAAIRSFTGYFLDGDWPRILDLKVSKVWNKHQIQLYTTLGINDYPFVFSGIGWKRYF